MNIKVVKQIPEYKDVDLNLPLYLYYQDVDEFTECYYKITEREIICLETKGNNNVFYKQNYQYLPSRYLNYEKTTKAIFEEIKKDFITELQNL